MKALAISVLVTTCIIAFSSFESAHFTNLPAVDTSLSLGYITVYPVKIDGGCSFITYDSLPLDKRKYIFIVSAREVGSMELINGKKSIVLKQVSKETLSDKASVETFAGQGYKVILKTKEAAGKLEDWPYYKGALQLKFQKKTIVYKIHGTKS